jgi:hypothetical protein
VVRLCAVVSDQHHFFHHHDWLDALALPLLSFRFLQLALQVSHLLSQAAPLLPFRETQDPPERRSSTFKKKK